MTTMEIKNTPDLICFTKVDLPHGWLGNMAPYPVEFDGLRWRTTEALFQALRFDDLAIREEIRNQPSPMSAKMVAKRHLQSDAVRVQPRSPEDLENMRLCLRLKLDCHSELQSLLIATENAVILEDASKRRGESARFWGCQLGEDGIWRGVNQLGLLWMELRDSVKK